jgi:tetratricopeptide (TPR) repeat protein
LSWSSPDKALPYSGLGNVLFRMQEYEFAIRCFLKVKKKKRENIKLLLVYKIIFVKNFIFFKKNKARERRECTIGGDNIETASTYNNLGCCFNILERNKEAQTYYELAHAIFDLELGPFH